MARDVLIRLTGSDDLSPTLVAVGSAAGTAATKLKELESPVAGIAADSATAAQGMGNLEDELSALATDTIKQGAQALLAVAGGVALMGQNYRQHQTELDKMGRIFGDTATGITDLIDALGGSTLFGESDLVKGFNELATLADQLDVQKFEDLSTAIADIATVNDESFATTAERVAEALNGQGEGLREMGIELEGDNPIERLNSLLTKTEPLAGAAEKATEGMYGWLTAMKNDLGGLGRDFADFLGPFGEIGAFAADNALEIGIMSLALKQVADVGLSAHRLLGTAGLAGGLMGPVGLAAAAIAAGVALKGLFDMMNNEAPIATEAAAENLENVYDLIVKLGDQGLLTGTRLGITEMLEDFTTGFDEIENLLERAGNLEFAKMFGLDEALTGERLDEFASSLSTVEQELVGWNDLTADGVLTMAEWSGAMDGLESQLQDLSPAAEAVNAEMEQINEIMLAQGPAADEARQELLGYLQALETGEMTPDEFRAGVDGLTQGLDAQAAALAKLSAARAAFNADQAGDASAMFGDIQMPNFGDLEAWATGQQAAIDAYAAVIEESFRRIDAAVSGSTDRLTTAFRVIVSNTDALADQTQQVEDWIVALSESRDVQEEVGIIMQANQQVQQAVLDIQEQQAPIIAQLTAEQAVFMDQLRDMPADQQLVTLGFMDTALAAQAMELAMLPLSGLAPEVFTPMIESAAMADPILRSMLESIGLITTTIDENGDMVITVNTDGALSPIQELTDAIGSLEDTLITIFLDLDTSDFAASLVDAQGDAADMMADIGAMTAIPAIEADTTDFDAGASAVQRSLTSLGNTTATPTVNLRDNASSGLAGIKGLIDSLYSKTITVTTNYVSTGAAGGFPMGVYDGGMIPSFASGGMVNPTRRALTAEHGHELVAFAEGGMAMMRGEGVRQLMPGDMVFSAPATRSMMGGTPAGGSINVTVQGPIIALEQYEEELATRIYGGIADAVQMRRLSFVE